MNKEQIDCLRRYISKNDGVSNRKLADIVVSQSNTFKGYSPGSVANYIGKVKKMDPKTVSDKSGSLMGEKLFSTPTPEPSEQELPANDAGYVYIAIMGLDKRSSKAAITNMVNKITGAGLEESEKAVDNCGPESAIVMSVQEDDAKEVMSELHGYGALVGIAVIEKDNDNTYSRVSAILADKLGLDLEHISLSSNIKDDLGADSLDIVEIAMNMEMEFDIVISEDEIAAITTVASLVNFISSNLVDEELPKKADYNNIKTGASPAGYAPEQPEEETNIFEEDLPNHYDYLVVSVKSEMFKLDYSVYTDMLNKNCKNKVIIFGNEPRVETIENGTISGAHGGVGGAAAVGNGGGGLQEDFCIYDAIDVAVATAVKDCEDPFKDDVNITIAVPHITDWGSKYASKASVVEVINQVKSDFGWSVNLLVADGDANDAAVALGIDSSNAINYCYAQEALDMMIDAREKRTVALSEDEKLSTTGYFKG